jgi:tetratricopeptide (TPR) repeat protein
MRSRSLTRRVSRLIKWVAIAWVAGIHSRMDPNLGSEINDTARTGLEAVQAYTTWRRAAGAPRQEAEAGEGAIAVPGASTEIPAVPRAVHGRGDVVEYLLKLAEARCPRYPQLLAGAGGMGKSTIARLVATKIRDSDPRRRTWWISAADEERLSAGLVSVARDLGASTADQEAIRSHVVAGLGDITDRFWRLLDRGPSRWLLVIDNADDPGLLGPSDGTGWVRSTRNGLLLITTRNGDVACWPDADFIPVLPLPLEAAADVLTDLAPHAGDGEAAAALADRLGRLPLALRIAGMYLRQEFVSWRTFDDYRRALDAEGSAAVIGASEHSDSSLVLTRTWELSLDALASSGRPQSRPLMWLLSCFAPGSCIPEELITTTGPDPSLISLLASGEPASERRFAEFCMAGLRGLAVAGLIQRSNPAAGPAGIEIHPFISEVTRSVMESSDPAQTGIAPRTVRECAIAVIQTALSRLDPGSAEHWPYFSVLTPHVTGLLTGAAPHLGMKHRQILLNGMVRCIASYMWSRAEARAQQLAVDTLAVARRLEADHESVYQRLRHMRAWSLREQGRFPEAEALFREVLAELMRMPGGAMRGDTLRARHDLAWTIGRQGNWAAAEEAFRDVLRRRRERRLGRGGHGDDPDILHTRCMLYWSIGKQGRWAEAEGDYRQLTADRTGILGSYHADTLDTRENIGKALAWQGRWAEAEREWGQLTALRSAALGERNADTLRTRQLAAYAAGRLAREDGNRASRRRATAVLREILDAQTDVRGEDHRETRETRALLADLDGKARQGSSWPEDLPQPTPADCGHPGHRRLRRLRDLRRLFTMIAVKGLHESKTLRDKSSAGGRGPLAPGSLPGA